MSKAKTPGKRGRPKRPPQPPLAIVPAPHPDLDTLDRERQGNEHFSPDDKTHAMLIALDYLRDGITLNEVCRVDPRLPRASTLRQWFAADADLYACYARARDLGIEAMVEQMLEIANDGRNDWIVIEKDGRTRRVVDVECVMRSRVRIDSIKFYVSKIAPRRYGDKLDVTSDGEKVGTVQVMRFGDLEVNFT